MKAAVRTSLTCLSAVPLAGKYIAGLIAAVVIFSVGTAFCFGTMLWSHDPAQVSALWQEQGPAHLLGYVTAAILGCIGYGSVFLAAGLLLRNPIIPAVVILHLILELWNPDLAKKLFSNCCQIGKFSDLDF